MKKTFLLLALVLIASVALIGCGGNGSADEGRQGSGETKQENRLERTVSIMGSTSIQPVVQSLADAFSSIEPGIQVDIQGVGSTAGVKAVNDETADIGIASRELKKEEKEWGLIEHIIAMDGIAITIHPSNNIADLTKDQVAKIFKGEITNWNEVGGADKKIIVISREDGSGTRGAFDEILGNEGELSEKALFAEGNGAVKQNIATKEDAIGYVSLGYLDNSIKAVMVDGVEVTVENIKEGKYPVARPFLMLTKGELSPESKLFLDFIMSDEGQEIVAEDYISIK